MNSKNATHDDDSTETTTDLLTPSDAEIADAFGVEDVDDITDEMLDDVETPEVPERVDVSGYSTAAGAAKATHAALQEWAEFYSDDPDAVLLWSPEETAQKRDMRGDVDCWTICWEGGPFEWAPALTGGESIHWNAGFGATGDPQVTGLLDSDKFGVECYYSFDIQFFNK